MPWKRFALGTLPKIQVDYDRHPLGDILTIMMIADNIILTESFENEEDDIADLNHLIDALQRGRDLLQKGEGKKE
jgi:hypothetical protein